MPRVADRPRGDTRSHCVSVRIAVSQRRVGRLPKARRTFEDWGMTSCAPAAASGRWAHDARARDVSERGRAGLAHDRHEFAVEDVEHRLDAALTEGSQPPGLRPANADRGRPERERLEDVSAAADAAVDEHRDAAL